MKKSLLIAAALCAGGIPQLKAQCFGFGVSFGYVAPCPPPMVMMAPAPIYMPPPQILMPMPVVYAPSPVMFAPPPMLLAGPTWQHHPRFTHHRWGGR